MKKKSVHEELAEIVAQAKRFLKEEKLLGYNDVFYSGKSIIPGSPGSQSVDKTSSLMKLKEEVCKCEKCHLHRYKLNYVFGEGNPDSAVMFVGEGPGYQEDREGRPFVGPAGQLLTKIIESTGLKREGVYIANIVKCHPMIDPRNSEQRGNDRPPNPEEMSSCIGYLYRQMETINPGIIVALGNTSAQALLETTEGISKLRGKIHNHNDFKILPTYHPAALLRNPDLKRDVWTDMKILKNILKI